MRAVTGALHHSEYGREERHYMHNGGARWAVERGYGLPEDLERIEERGRTSGARPECVSDHAKKRQEEEMGTLGSGNHYLEVQLVDEGYDVHTGGRFELEKGRLGGGGPS